MSAKVLICDDSSVARKQLSKLLPADWTVTILFAEHGEQALEILESEDISLMFLDLNMPVLDGYQTLERMQQAQMATKVIVVSGDVQAQALERVKSLGAIDFLKKPATKDIIRAALEQHGFMGDESNDDSHLTMEDEGIEFSLNDCLQEVSNVAMGRAASVLADMLGVFVKLPVPNVNMLEVSELQMALGYNGESNRYSAVSQGFVATGIALEALLVFSDSSFPDMAKLLGYQEKLNKNSEVELLMDVSSALVGPFILALARQLNIDFSDSHPVVLGQHVKNDHLINAKKAAWKQTLAVEITYEVENYQVSCDLILLFTEDSVATLENLLSYLSEDE
ncbi:MAG: response regulator [Marinomonas sp.]|uniref:response regulator n=1 Tax=unclassified Marinomonas TaxID=196814 RepID=UPI0007AF8C11|nr:MULTISPECIES: response regulator [unclassified Marinomonas]KZM40351.1 chemotaxis protein CheC [Marinomonas sp. SBI22]KZM41768.1 chemotaxis protein CheC [Marinomonas sp. SBI8L]